jgi:hypothetical protein
VTRGAAFFAAVLVAIGRPAWWLMALATFLLRGGIVLVLLPIVTLPTPLALSNAFAPLLLPLAFGRIEPAIVVGAGLLVVLLLVWLVGGGRIAAGIDVAFVREAATAAIDEGVAGRDDPSSPDGAALPPPRRSTKALGWRVLAVRLIAWLPLALAIGIGLARIVQVTYVELTRPVDVDTPLVVRVAGEAVSQLGLIVVAWIVGEVIGGVASRRVVLGRGRHGSAIERSVLTTAARPLSWLVPWIGTTVILFVVMGFTLAASASAWTRAVAALSDRRADPLVAIPTLLIFVTLWLAAMFLGGVILAVRSASQTFEHVRLMAAASPGATGQLTPVVEPHPGTFGGSARSRPGDWSPHDEGGSL